MPATEDDDPLVVSVVTGDGLVWIPPRVADVPVRREPLRPEDRIGMVCAE